MGKDVCCLCGEPLDLEGRDGKICPECKVSLQIIRTKDEFVVTR